MSYWLLATSKSSHIHAAYTIPGVISLTRRRTTTRLFNVSRKTWRQRKAEEKNGVTSPTLDWEKFEFSDNPKWDTRFSDDLRNNNATPEDFEKFTKEEAIRDRETAIELEKQHNAYASLLPDIVAQATEILEPYINADRLNRIDTVLAKRTKNARFLFENPSNPSNVWACLRTIDSFGIQNVDLVINSGMYEGKAAISQKRGMRTAMGSAGWLSLRNYPSTKDAVKEIRENLGYKIYASDLNPNSKDVRDLDWDVGPVCIVMGNEDKGISEEMRDLADETFTLPMVGFAESFNLSVATAITLAHMSAASRDGEKEKGGKPTGPLRPGDLDEHEFNCLRLKGLLNSLPQRRTGPALLKQKGIILPDDIKFL